MIGGELAIVRAREKAEKTLGANGADGISDIEHVASEGMELFGESDIEGKAARWVAARELGSERVSIARVAGNAARVAGASTGKCE